MLSSKIFLLLISPNFNVRTGLQEFDPLKMLAPNLKTVAVILVMIVPFVCAYVDKAGK